MIEHLGTGACIIHCVVGIVLKLIVTFLPAIIIIGAAEKHPDGKYFPWFHSKLSLRSPNSDHKHLIQNIITVLSHIFVHCTMFGACQKLFESHVFESATYDLIAGEYLITIIPFIYLITNAECYN